MGVKEPGSWYLRQSMVHGKHCSRQHNTAHHDRLFAGRYIATHSLYRMRTTPATDAAPAALSLPCHRAIHVTHTTCTPRMHPPVRMRRHTLSTMRPEQCSPLEVCQANSSAGLSTPPPPTSSFSPAVCRGRAGDATHACMWCRMGAIVGGTNAGAGPYLTCPGTKHGWARPYSLTCDKWHADCMLCS